MTEKPLNDLFLAQLKDIYFAEKQIYKTLPKVAKATGLPEVADKLLTQIGATNAAKKAAPPLVPQRL
jgi:ferritin-like metal-binding protein YciE